MKVFGNIKDFAYIKRDDSRTVICYGLEGDGDNATWHEVVIYKKKVTNPNIEQIRQAIVDDINNRVSERILTGFVWKGLPIWLSKDNQRNISDLWMIAKQTDGANLPVTLKLNEDENGKSVFHTFYKTNELLDFYKGASGFIIDCLNDGWNEKDSIDYGVYEKALGPKKGVEPKSE